MTNIPIDTTEVIKVQNIQQSFRVGDETISVLKQANFGIRANSFTLIFGPSGSGKSTLLNALGGIQKPTSGTVTIQGQDIYGLSANELAYFRANRIGFMHQTNHWIKSLNVIENISVPLFFLGYSKPKAHKLAELALDRVNMGAYAKKMPFLLSGGEQQRIGMARALANDPLFIIADEPTGNLDTTNGDAIMQLLLTCQTEFRRTIILVTHNLEYISLADQLVKIQDGIVEDIPAKDTKKVTDVLIGDINTRIEQLTKAKNRANHN
jgi:putative ABC transport system ATP-binding protein